MMKSVRNWLMLIVMILAVSFVLNCSDKDSPTRGNENAVDSGGDSVESSEADSDTTETHPDEG